MVEELSKQRKRDAIFNPNKPNRKETLTLINVIDSAVPQDYLAREYADNLIQRLRDGYYIQTGRKLR